MENAIAFSCSVSRSKTSTRYTAIEFSSATKKFEESFPIWSDEVQSYQRIRCWMERDQQDRNKVNNRIRSLNQDGNDESYDRNAKNKQRK